MDKNFEIKKLIVSVLTVCLFMSLAINLQAKIIRKPDKVSPRPADPNARVIPVKVSVDPRVELMSIIFRLAGHPEYNRCAVTGYSKDIEKQFGPYRSHQVVKLAADLRRRRGVSYDAPMSMAVHIKDVNNLSPKIPFVPHPEGLDSRWKIEEANDFLDKAGQFVKESNFEKFIKDHQPLYKKAVTNMETLLEKEMRFEWFNAFFGKRSRANFHVVIALSNGPNNYGTRFKFGGKEELYCIKGVHKSGFLGMAAPKFDKGMVSTIVHEFCHSYVNPVVSNHSSELEKSGPKLFSKAKKKMTRMAYGNWRTMIIEYNVRASVARYLLAKEGKQAAEKSIRNDVKRGFLHVRGLSGLLGEYESDREKYPTYDSFFPRIVEYFNTCDSGE